MFHLHILRDIHKKIKTLLPEAIEFAKFQNPKSNVTQLNYLYFKRLNKQVPLLNVGSIYVAIYMLLYSSCSLLSKKARELRGVKDIRPLSWVWGGANRMDRKCLLKRVITCPVSPPTTIWSLRKSLSSLSDCNR